MRRGRKGGAHSFNLEILQIRVQTNNLIYSYICYDKKQAEQVPRVIATRTTVLRRRVQTPDPSGHRETYVRNRRQNGSLKRDRPSRRAAASLRPPAASLGGSEVRRKAGRVRAEAWEGQFPERDASVPRRTASQQTSFHAPFAKRKGACETAHATPSSGGCSSQGPGDRTWSRQTSTTRPPRGGGYSASEAPKADPRKAAELRTATPVVAPNSMPAVWRRGPCLETVASGLLHRICAASDPSPGSSAPVIGSGDGEGRSRGPSARTEARGEGQFLRGPKTLSRRAIPHGRPGGKDFTHLWTYKHALIQPHSHLSAYDCERSHSDHLRR